MVAHKNNTVRAKLGKFTFGGIVRFLVITQHWQTKQEVRTYTIELPCKLYIETTEILGVE